MQKTNEKKVRVGQIGCGYWGRNLLRVLNQASGSDLSLAIDASPSALGYVKSAYPSVETDSNLERLLTDDSIDAVVIATPAADHYLTARLALMSGKHVFVEKPLALTERDARTLVTMAESKGLTLMAGHTFLYNSAVRKIKDLIDSGELGDIYYIYSRRLNLGIVRKDVNVLWNLAPHDVSIILYWLEAEPVFSSASGGVFLQRGVEDVVFMNMAFPSGAVANVHLSWLDPHKVRDMTVVGSKKMAVFDDVSSDAKVTIFDMGIDVQKRMGQGASFDTFGDFQLLKRYGDIVIPRVDYPEPLAEEVKHFIHCINTGEQPLTGGSHAVAVVKALEQADQSLKDTRAGRLAQSSQPAGTR